VGFSSVAAQAPTAAVSPSALDGTVVLAEQADSAITEIAKNLFTD
jgi:hypothetical protein